MIEIIISTIIGGAIGIFGIYFGYWLTRSDSREIIRITEFNKARASFRSAFAPTLAVIDISKKVRTRNQLPTDIDTALWGALLKQATEIELFRPYVAKKTQDTYQEAWDKYLEEAGNYGFEATTFRTDIDNPWKVFEDLIHNILQFAKEK
jgi:ABC-type thiamine transport system substrate-binding protein